MAKPSTQHKLDRVRPPRVQITYDVETGGAIEIKELPFVVGVLGDFTGQPEQPLPKDSTAGQLRVDLRFKSLEDFEPEQVARQVKPLKELLDLRTRLNDLKGTLQTNEKLDEALLDAVSKTDKLDKLKAEVGPKGEPNA